MLRNILMAILFISCISTGFAQTKIEKKFPNGTIEQIGYLNKDTLRDSTWLLYNIDGKLKAEAYYKDGMKIGIWKTYHDNGKLMFEIPYINGIKSGEGKQYDNIGQLIATKNY